MSELITIYHGTAGALKNNIRTRDGLYPKPGNTYVYVTTDPDVARQYSRAWTAWSLHEAEQIKKLTRKSPQPTGLIIKTVIDKSLLKDDPYNPEGEPNQYRVRGCLGLDDAEMIDVDFSEEFSVESNVMSAYCYWIGIGRATDN